MLKVWVTLASGRLVRLACGTGVEWGLSLYASALPQKSEIIIGSGQYGER